MNSLILIASMLAVLFVAILAIAAIGVICVGLNEFLAPMTGDRLRELAVLTVIGLTLALAVFFVALWLLPF
jgi:hypothetical protein